MLWQSKLGKEATLKPLYESDHPFSTDWKDHLVCDYRSRGADQTVKLFDILRIPKDKQNWRQFVTLSNNPSAQPVHVSPSGPNPNPTDWIINSTAKPKVDLMNSSD